MPNYPLAFAEILAGSILIDYGIKAFQGGLSTAQASGGTGGAVSTVPGGALASPNSSGYVNPFAKIRGGMGALTRERLDMGWDFHTSGAGDPILSIGNAKVTAILNDWWQGQPLIMTQLTSGPDAGKLVYYAEGLVPNVSVGQTVVAGQQIATTTAQPSGLEFGWGGSASGQTLQQVIAPGSGDTAGAAADSFHAFLTSLGV
jgi:murein DD-endopeptidase MepM/ murein hydrolase activator NlpD